MDSQQLARGLCVLNRRNECRFSVGVYAADKIPYKILKPAAFIVNTDYSHQPGLHWVAFFIPMKGKTEYFDSYGIEPFVDTHVKFLANHKWTFNNIEMQSLTSNVCGHYCLMFLASRMNGHSLHKFQSLFTKNLKGNDALVKKCSKNVLKHVKSSHLRGGQRCCARLEASHI
jgi:hypothetical protein